MYGLSNTATAVIKVTDINDNLPEFTAEKVRNNLSYEMSTPLSSFNNIATKDLHLPLVRIYALTCQFCSLTWFLLALHF